MDAVRSPGVDAECGVAETVGTDPVPGFGATDCDCGSHLAYATERETLSEAVREAYRAAGDRPADEGSLYLPVIRTDRSHMSKATKMVLATVGTSALLVVAIVVDLALV